MLFKRTFGPHFHALYNGSEAIVGIFPIRIINGEIPDWVRTMVVEWATQHQQELLLN